MTTTTAPHSHDPASSTQPTMPPPTPTRTATSERGIGCCTLITKSESWARQGSVVGQTEQAPTASLCALTFVPGVVRGVPFCGVPFLSTFLGVPFLFGVRLQGNVIECKVEREWKCWLVGSLTCVSLGAQKCRI